MTVAAEVASASASRFPSWATSRGAITRRAPTASGRKISSPAMSNDRVVTARRVSSLVSPGSRAIETRKLTTARWGTDTPLGLPVEPEV